MIHLLNPEGCDQYTPQNFYHSNKPQIKLYFTCIELKCFIGQGLTDIRHLPNNLHNNDGHQHMYWFPKGLLDSQASDQHSSKAIFFSKEYTWTNRWHTEIHDDYKPFYYSRLMNHGSNDSFFDWESKWSHFAHNDMGAYEFKPIYNFLRISINMIVLTQK